MLISLIYKHRFDIIQKYLKGNRWSRSTLFWFLLNYCEVPFSGSINCRKPVNEGIMGRRISDKFTL